MKTKYLLIGAIFTVFGLTARGQVYEMYSQGFETSDGVNYTIGPSSGGSFSTNIYSGGSRALKLTQQQNQEVEFILDTIDLTTNTQLNNIVLRFDHICRVRANSGGDAMMGTIFAKCAYQGSWTIIGSQYYNITEGSYSHDFTSLNGFNENSYLNNAGDWIHVNNPTVDNSQWHSERFDLNQILSNVPNNERKLIIKFVLRGRTLSGTYDSTNESWWIDNVRVLASSSPMVTPRITMLDYPEIEEFPHSRGVRVALKATTTVSAGIHPDSVYLFYTVGSDPTPIKLPIPLTAGTTNQFECRIPFYGYDTLMRFYCVARDATTNANQVTFPPTVDTWINYRCVRGLTSQPGMATQQFTGTGNSANYPFPADATHRAEFVYDSALLADAGYGPGAITSLRFMIGANVNQAQTLDRFQIKMKNVNTDYYVDVFSTYSDFPFTSDYMRVVYDSSLSIPVLSAGLEQTINFQDTFFYAGKDILVQITYDNPSNAVGATIKTIPAISTKQTLYFWHGWATYNYNPFTNSEDLSTTNDYVNTRPAFVFSEMVLQPLLHDVGISELVSPSYTVPMTERPGSLRVKLKNFGERTVNAVRISYDIDDTISGFYDWTGTLAGGQEAEVTIATTINIPAGYHYLTAWVEDTVTASGVQYRDHEPYNDTSASAFIVCDGPMNGVKNIGGSNADFNDIEEFLFSLSRCGIDDSLIVRLAPGSYPAFTMPSVTGLNQEHYIVFESMNSTQAVIYSDVNNTQNSIVNLEAVDNMRFRNLKFVRRSGALTNMVLLGVTSDSCSFEGCSFLDSLAVVPASLRIAALLDNGYANNMTVDSCTFVGGRIGVNVKGQAPDIRSNGSVVRKSLFSDQYENAVNAENQDNVVVVDNEMYDVQSNLSYVVLLNECYGNVSLERNRVFTSHGAGAIGLNNVVGTATNHAIVANNMVVCNDDGNSNLMRSPLNVIQAHYVDVVYNSVKLTAPQRANVAAATFGGTALTNSTFANNIVVSLDNVNFALSYQPLGSTSNTLFNNDYFSNGAVLNRRGSNSYTSLAAWQVAMPEDSLSLSVNPNFLNGSLVDLRTYNRAIKGAGVPFAGVTTDLYGTVRGDSVTCPGAFEFAALPYDFEPEVLHSPLADNCNMPAQVELVVRLRNSGINVFNPDSTSTLQLAYKVNNGPVHTVNVNQIIPADDTITFATGQMLSMPPAANDDVTYTLRVWTIFAGDPNQTNDTNTFTIVSRYHPAAPANDTVSIPYATTATITPTAGVNTWKVYNSNSAPRRPSTLFWYADSLGDTPFYIGPSYTTDTLHNDQLYYVRQRRAMPIVRITQVEILHNATAAGVSNPMPYWMLDSRKAAVQLTNVGDATAYLQGDTLMTVSPSSSMNNKVYVFPNVKIEPGESLVVQYVGNGVTDSTLTLRNGFSFSIAYNANIGFVYKRGGVVEDALPLNNVITENSTQAVKWSTLGVPSYVWSGGGFSLPVSTAGLIRVGFNGNSNDWEPSTASFPMFLGSINGNWIRYIDNGCEGDMGVMAVTIQAPPTVEIEVGAPDVPETGCGLGDEDITVRIRNYGSDTVTNLVMNYYAGEDTITETIVGDILPFGDTVYTFTTQLNLGFTVDTTVAVRVWADSVAGDPMRSNDTNQSILVALYTPPAPDTIGTRSVPYSYSDTITLSPNSNLIPVWYNYDMLPIDTGYTHITERLYAEGTRGVSYMVMNSHNVQVGTGTSITGNTAYPSPYQPSGKFVKQQYIYSAYEMSSMGLQPGYITALSFYLDTIVGNVDSINYLNYTIALGTTDDTIFATNTSWKDAPMVKFQRDVFTLHQDEDHAWVTHQMNSPLLWDGVSSLVVQVTYEMNPNVSSGVRTGYTSKANTTLHKNQNTALQPSTIEYTGTGTKGGNRPNIKFASTIYGCEGPMTTFNVTLTGMPQVDANIYWPEGFDTLVYNSCDTIALPIKVRNQGSTNIDSMMLYYYLDDLAVDSTLVSDSIAPGQVADVELFNLTLLPGRHSVMAIAHAVGDSIPSNDTVRGVFVVRFCGGTYTISTDGTADYPSFGAAIDTLNQVGILGPVVFNVSAGTYNEQVTINSIDGSSPTNTISFVGVDDSVLLTASTSQYINYVMNLDGVSNLRLQNIMMEARPVQNNVNYGNVLVMQNDSNINVTDCYFKVKGTLVNANASCIVMQNNVSGLTITGTVTDSGYYAVRTLGNTSNFSSIHLYNNIFRDFASQGINLRGVSNVQIANNQILSGNSANNRGLIGVYIAESTDTMYIQKNKIYLIDERQGAKRGIQLEGVTGTVITPAFVVNNVIGTYSTDSKGLPSINNKTASAGIVIDSSSAYVNVYFNSVRVRGTNSVAASVNELTYGFFSGNTPSNIQVLNNIFANYSYGYAYYVSELNTVVTSNYNAYFTEAANRFTWKITGLTTLTDLQNQNSDDGNSLFEEPYFTGSDDLHLLMTNFVGRAQYNTDVMDDIDGVIREQVPGPTIGAYEMSRLTHDMAIVRIHTPTMPANINQPTNIETDSVLVKVSIYNNGRSNETNISWYAYIDNHQSVTQSVVRNLGSFAPSQMKVDSVMVPAPLGIIDTQYIHVVLNAAYDTALANNELTERFYLAPAFNLKAQKMEAPSGCDLQAATIRIYLKNDGSKPFAAGTTVKVGYHTEITNPANLVVSTLPDTVEEYVTFDNPLPVGSTVFFDFATPANLYPTGYYQNIKVRVRGWCNYQYDITRTNDTTGATDNTASPVKDSYYTPAAPEGHDTTLAYGTWGAVTAEQINSRPIRWHRDTTAAPFYNPTQYNASKKWSNTPQYFHDSTYYLNCVSDKSCTSAFSSVTVQVAPRITRDMAIEQVYAPLGSRVYMENDTVRVRIANYGTAAQSNFPITYELKRGNNVLQTVTEQVTQSVAPGDTLVYTFDSLLTIPTPTSQQNYSLNVWTDLTNDGTRRNDTIRYIYTFTSYAQDRYTNFSTGTFPSAEYTHFDITRISFNGIDMDIPVLNRSYTNLADYNEPDYPVLHVTRGTSDSIFVEVTSLDPTESRFRCRATIGVDFNRDGEFANGACNELFTNGDVFYNDTIFSTLITIPDCASLGYMRMRVKVMGYADEATDGHIVDFLLFVDDEAPAQDLGITQIVSPRNNLIRDDLPRTISFRITNRGQSVITSADLRYTFNDPENTTTNIINWTGSLAPGTSTVVSLPSHTFPTGTTRLTIWHEMPGDADSTNNHLYFEYHKFRVVRATYNDDFDSDINDWYAPEGRSEFSRNYWQRGMPAKTRIDSTYSGDNAWVTDLNNPIVTGKRGNVSYLYSPIFNTAQIRTDTLSFRLFRNLTGGSTMHVEYYNYANKWVKLNIDSLASFYTDLTNAVFSGTSSNSERYRRHYMSTVVVRSDMHERTQLRFVYTTPMGSSANSAYGEGCAIDDFHFGRARRAIDAGVVAIPEPAAPKYGQTIYPMVEVKNYGTDTLRSVQIGYTHYGSYLAKITDITCAIPPLATDTFRFDVPFVVTSDYPDSFYIKAFTILSTDLYKDNDTTERLCYLAPLDNDISAEGFVSPLDHVIAGDSTVKVTMRLRNFGYNDITEATATYTVNGIDRVEEHIDFMELMGRPLRTMEFYNYTFNRRIHASMGVMRIVAYIKSPNNDYIYNDTISKRIEGIVSITDIATASVIVDTSDHENAYFGLVIENRGARGVNNFEVGFYIDKDTNTMVRETYYRAEPLAALTTGYYRFNQYYPSRNTTGGYRYVTGFVHVPGDNDPANDTSSTIATHFCDAEVIKILVEENAANDCRVFLELTNVGNITLAGQQIRMRASINGDADSNVTNIARNLDPGDTVHLQFNRRIPKSPIRRYVGTGWIRPIHGDDNHANDQTSIVEVINYMEGTPTVENDKLVLEQNYPNPFSHQTTIPFTLPHAARVRLFVMDAMGHIVYRAEKLCQAGSQSMTLDMDAFAAGIYYYGIEVDGERQMRKMILR